MKEQREKIFSGEAGISKLLLDNGRYCEIFLPENPRDRLPFENEYCKFKPVGWVRLKGIWFPLGYKVVTQELQSLGLRNNPNIMTFPVCRWVTLQDSELVPGMSDFGGIWTAQRKGSIKNLKEHCLNTWEMETRGFLTAMSRPIFANEYRIKSQGVMLLKEIRQETGPWRS